MRDNFNLPSALTPVSSAQFSKKTSGFTLIEIMMAVGILGIIVAVAVPQYQSQKRKSYRSDAVILLTTAAQMQERIRTETGAYSNTLTDLTPNELTTSPEGKYQLSIENYAAETYTMVATALGPQLADSSCTRFEISHTGVKSAKNSDAAPNAKCWPQ